MTPKDRLRFLLTVLTIILVLLLGIKIVQAEESKMFYGMGFNFGGQLNGDPLWHTTGQRDWQEFAFVPQVGVHLDKHWDLWLEGRLEYLNWKKDGDAVKLGALLMTSYDILKPFYIEAGGGFGYRTYSPSNKTLGTNILGFIDYGLGVKFKLSKRYTGKVGLRFEHSSSVPGADTGINSYETSWSILW